LDASPVALILIGGAVSLISTLSTIVLSHWLEGRQLDRQVKRHPARVVYNKQTGFIDNTLPVLDRINGYITQIDVWLGETGPAANKKVAEAARSNKAVAELHDVLQRFYVYLPSELVEGTNALFAECLLLGSKPTHARVSKCYDALFSFQNSLRRSVGSEELSIELMRALGSRRRTRRRRASPEHKA
jgi:hypothetical protein